MKEDLENRSTYNPWHQLRYADAPYNFEKRKPMFEVLYDFRYRINDAVSINIPAGYLTDLATIPRSLRWLYDPNGPYAKAAIVHDYLYTQKPYLITRGRCPYWDKWFIDHLFRRDMPELGTSPLDTRLIYTGVRTPFADKWWNKY